MDTRQTARKHHLFFRRSGLIIAKLFYDDIIFAMERQNNLRWHAATERAADHALFHGESALARTILLDGVWQSYLHSPEVYHNFALKTIALPFYELAHDGPTDDRLKQASVVYGWTGELISYELDNLQPNTTSGIKYARSLGRLSELTVFGLLARDFKDDQSLVPLPASRDENTRPEAGTDFYLFSLHSSGQNYRLQVKTRLHDDDLNRYSSSGISLVGLNQIDPFYNRPKDGNSLARTMLKELDGTALPVDIDRLEEATRKLNSIIRPADSFQQAG